MSAHLRCLSPILVVVLASLFAGCHSGPQDPAVDPGSAAGRVSLSQAGLRGDLNRNGLPDVADAIGILRIVVGLDPANALADCDGDGNPGIADAILVLRCVVGLDGWPLGGVTETIGRGGGTVTTVDGNVLVDVPSGALDADTDITVSPQSTWPIAAGVVPGTCYEFGPDGTQFSQPAQLTIT